MTIVLKQREYFENTLKILLTKYGPSGGERFVLSFVEKEILSFSDENITLVNKPEEYGLFAVCKSKYNIKNSESNKNILFDCHVDNLLRYFEEVYIFNDTNEFGQKRKLVTATGIDNRISCAIGLTLLKFHRFEKTSYTVLFSTNGLVNHEGSVAFSKGVDLRDSYGLETFAVVFVQIIEAVRKFDVEDGSEEREIVVGSGFVPFLQARNLEYVVKKTGLDEVYSKKDSKYRNASSHYFGVGCYDKTNSESLGCISDGYELFAFLGSDLLLKYLNADEKTRDGQKFHTFMKKSVEEYLLNREVEVKKEEEEVEGEGEEDED